MPSMLRYIMQFLGNAFSMETPTSCRNFPPKTGGEGMCLVYTDRTLINSIKNAENISRAAQEYIRSIHQSKKAAETWKKNVYQVKLSSTKSTTVSPCTALTAPLTSSAKAPGPQTVTHMAPTCSWISLTRRRGIFGRPGNMRTVLLALVTSLGFCGRVTKIWMRRISFRLGMRRIWSM